MKEELENEIAKKDNSHFEVKQIWITNSKILSLINIEDLNKMNVSSFWDFVNFQILLNDKINTFFEEEIKNESEDFKKAMIKSCTSNTFKWFKSDDNKEIIRLSNIILRKKEIYLSYFLNSLETNKFEKILKAENIETLKIILKSGFIQEIDKIFLDRDSHKITEYQKPEIQVYWFLNKDLAEVSFAHWNIEKFEKFREDFEKIPNENIRNYLINFIDFSLSGNTNYDDFIEIENYALKTWDNESELWFMNPLENYNLEWYTDLEFSFVLKDIANWLNKSKFYWDLFTKYFSNDYKTNEISVFNVEKFVSNWNSSFMMILGQAFPNDIKSKEKYGNKITIYNSNIRKSVEELAPITKNIISNIWDFDIEKSTNYNTQFTISHEFSHSLFKNWYSSKLEEAKASYWYIFELFDKYFEKEIPSEDIKYIIITSLIEIVKFARRDWIESYEQYIIYAKMSLANLIDSKILEFENNQIKVDYNQEKTKQFLEFGIKTLDEFKEIYENKDKIREEKLICEIEKKIENEYKIILDKLKEL